MTIAMNAAGTAYRTTYARTARDCPILFVLRWDSAVNPLRFAFTALGRTWSTHRATGGFRA